MIEKIKTYWNPALIFITLIGMFFTILYLVWAANSTTNISSDSAISDISDNSTGNLCLEDVIKEIKADYKGIIDSDEITFSVDAMMSDMSEDMIYLCSVYENSYGINLLEGIHGVIENGICRFNNDILSSEIQTLMEKEYSVVYEYDINKLIELFGNEFNYSSYITEIDDGRYDLILEDTITINKLSDLTDNQLLLIGTLLNKKYYKKDEAGKKITEEAYLPEMEQMDVAQMRSFLYQYGDMLSVSVPMKISVILCENSYAESISKSTEDNVTIYGKYTPVSYSIDGQIIMKICCNSDKLMGLAFGAVRENEKISSYPYFVLNGQMVWTIKSENEVY